MMLNLTSIASDDLPPLTKLADRIAGLVAHYPSERPEVVRLLLEFAEETKRAQQAEIEDLRISVIAFCGLWAVQYAKDQGLPPWHLFPDHYDILERAGARMESFKRAEVEAV
jgi:hypothetical protein